MLVVYKDYNINTLSTFRQGVGSLCFMLLSQ
jgi:hypothetical protein